MKKQKKSLLFVLFVILVIVVSIGGYLLFKSTRTETQGKPSLIKETTPTPIQNLTQYSNQEFGFSLSYPAEWALPKETKITPPQQHLYQIIFNSGETEYFVDIYRQMMPLPLSSFVRDYFTEANWSEEQKIGTQSVVRFFLPKEGLEPSGSAGVAFAKDNDVLVISTSILKGEKEKIVNDPILNQIAGSFSWQK